MAKIADEYFKVDPWRIIEEGFDPSYGMVGEAVFSLANEYMGVRGCFEENYSGESLQGSYFNGIYIREYREKPRYKGVTDIAEFLLNSVNWLKLRITLDGEILDLTRVEFSEFRRELDLRTGLLTRTFVWSTAGGKMTRLTFERLLSMENVCFGVQRVRICPVNYEGEITVECLADYGIIHQSQEKNYWEIMQVRDLPGRIWVHGRTSEGLQGVMDLVTDQSFLYDGQYSEAPADGAEEESERGESSVRAGEESERGESSVRAGEESDCAGENVIRTRKEAGKRFVLQVVRGEEHTLTRLVRNVRSAGFVEEAFDGVTFEGLLEENERWWSRVWSICDIAIQGDEKNQQGIRFCIFQMLQTYHGSDSRDNIGAKGLTGEAYGGNTFWDTETYCLPFYMLNLPEAARDLLLYRYHTLEPARQRARALDCEGAFYPISSISGRESCDLWQHASLQLQASTGVAYGIWFYEKLSEDLEFLKKYGAEILVEISRMLATRGSYDASGKGYGYYCVMGPDEFQMMVNNNCYTNFMGRFTMRYTLEVLEALEESDADWYAAFAGRLGLSEEECADWRAKADAMIIRKKGLLYEQHEGFFSLPHIDVDAIPTEEFPLYHSWSYDRLYRNDMIKQPDVLMFMLLFNGEFPPEELRANYEYYEPRCIHESSLSPSVHSILAAQIGREKEAYEFFGFATRLDLDNYNRNTSEGLHTTSIAAAWMNIVYGFGGVRTDGECLSIAPTIPASWEGYSFHLCYRGVRLLVEVSREQVTFTVEEGERLELLVYGEKLQLTDAVNIPLRAGNA